MAAAPSWERWSGTGRRRRAAERGWSSPGPPSSRWSGALAWIGCRRSRGSTGLCARTIELCGCPRGRGRPAPQGWGLRGPSLSPCGVVARCEMRLGGRRATCPAGAETGAGLPASPAVALLPAGGPQAQQLSDTPLQLGARGLVQEAFVDCSRLKGSTFFACLMGGRRVLEPKAVSGPRGS